MSEVKGAGETVYSATEVHQGPYMEDGESFVQFRKKIVEEGKREWLYEVKKWSKYYIFIALFGALCWAIGYASHS